MDPLIFVTGLTMAEFSRKAVADAEADYIPTFGTKMSIICFTIAKWSFMGAAGLAAVKMIKESL